MKEYQSVREKNYVLPRAVYYQCVWTVRDMERMEKTAGLDPGETAKRLECIRRALLEVPEEYRSGVLKSIAVRGTNAGDFAHENTWKRWRQRFIFRLAKNLGLY